jgi:thiol-disulfide isomerase/thioredoxin
MSNANVISSKSWYLCAAIVFMVWVAAAAVGKPAERNLRETLREFLADAVIGTRLVDDPKVNPAPSVVLEVTSAPWCGPCRQIKPTLRELKKQGYEIKIVETATPGKAVPYFEWKQFGEIVKQHSGVEGYPNLKAVEKTLKTTFSEIEGQVFVDG